MRFITYCPFCQTQFIATQEQLDSHEGQVRCGQCLQLFNAKSQILDTLTDSDQTDSDKATAQDLTTHAVLSSAVHEDTNNSIDQIAATTADKAIAQPAYLDDIASKSKLKRSIVNKSSRRGIWLIGISLLILTAVAQSTYYLRDHIALHYPHIKPFLTMICERINCTISLPQKVDFLVIDDSDIKEDSERMGLMRFSTILINTGEYAVAYPKLELTLTDMNEQPVLRRVLTPKDYLPEPSNAKKGLNAGEHIQIQLPITTDGIAVAGYRVFVTY